MSDDEIINTAIDELARLTGEDFHGYRSEVWGVLADVIREARYGGEVAISKKVLEEGPDACPQCGGWNWKTRPYICGKCGHKVRRDS